jgi:DNA-binding transcriptional regulator YiaG
MKTNSTQNTAKSAINLKVALTRLELSQAQFARIIDTPLRTVAGWCGGETKPPPMLWSILKVIEGSGQARRILHVSAIRHQNKPRGRPFRRGNEFRFTDKRRQEALARARAI